MHIRAPSARANIFCPWNGIPFWMYWRYFLVDRWTQSPSLSNSISYPVSVRKYDLILLAMEGKRNSLITSLKTELYSASCICWLKSTWEDTTLLWIIGQKLVTFMSTNWQLHSRDANDLDVRVMKFCSEIIFSLVKNSEILPTLNFGRFWAHVS